VSAFVDFYGDLMPTHYHLPDRLSSGYHEAHVRAVFDLFISSHLKVPLVCRNLNRWPGDLEVIWARLGNLNTAHGFAANARPFVVGEVSDGYDLARHGFLGSEYFSLGTITEFRYSEELSNAFLGNNLLKWLQSFGEGWDFWPSKYVLTFIGEACIAYSWLLL
jgi:hypothetical protein